jgi:hypothetical protein
MPYFEVIHHIPYGILHYLLDEPRGGSVDVRMPFVHEDDKHLAQVEVFGCRFSCDFGAVNVHLRPTILYPLSDELESFPDVDTGLGCPREDKRLESSNPKTQR